MVERIRKQNRGHGNGGTNQEAKLRSWQWWNKSGSKTAAVVMVERIWKQNRGRGNGGTNQEAKPRPCLL
jgi:hypothetical protein